MSDPNPGHPLKARAGVILFHENRMLLMKQNGKPFWVFPGGTLEPDETLAECAVRELKEEADLSIELTGLAAFTELLQAHRHVMDVFFWGRLVGDSPPLSWQAPHPENIDAIAWVALEEAMKSSIMPPAVAKRVVKAWALNQQDTSPNWGYLPPLQQDVT